MRTIVGGLLAALAWATAAPAQDAVSLRLNWVVSGFHAPFYLGVERGYFKDEGVALAIGEGKGGPVVLQAVGGGSDTFGMVDASAVITGAIRGIPIKTVISLQNTSSYAVIAREDSGIRAPKDLEGKKVGATAGDSLTLLWPAFARANRIDESKVTLVMLDPAGKSVATMENKTQALLGATDAQGLQLQARNVPVTGLRYADFGVPMVGLTIIAREDTISAKGDMVRRFARATRKSYEAAKAEPDAAVAAAVKAKPEADAAVLKAQLVSALQSMASANTKGLPIGVGSPEDWAKSVDFMTTYGGLKAGRKPETFYTNDFVK